MVGWQNWDCAGLENRWPLGLVGSNPTPTANTTRCSVGFQVAERWFLEAVLVGVGEEPTANQ
jgi:hypothetical protein